jgi:hypothetical protein
MTTDVMVIRPGPAARYAVGPRRVHNAGLSAAIAVVESEQKVRQLDGRGRRCRHCHGDYRRCLPSLCRADRSLRHPSDCGTFVG